MRRPDPPLSFVLLGGWFVYRALRNVGDLVGTVPDWSDPASIVARILAACAAVVMGVGAVALYRVERWAARPVAAWAFLWLLAEISESARGSMAEAETAFITLFFKALGPLLVVLYVRGRLKDFHPAAASGASPAALATAPPAAPRPRPRAGARLPRP